MNRLIFVSLILLCSCSSKIIPLKGAYTATPIIQYSDNPVDKVWDHVIDFFAQKGLAIKIIDKSSGLIISDKTALTWTYEDKKGVMKVQNRWVAIPQAFPAGSDVPLKPDIVLGEWNVRIKAEGSGTSVNVNLVNIEARYYEGTYYNETLGNPVRLDGKSTDIFEKIIFEAEK